MTIRTLQILGVLLLVTLCDCRCNRSASSTSGNGRTVPSLTVGPTRACVRRAEGVWCWGSNSFGELRQGGATEPLASPARVPTFDRTESIALGSSHVCAVTAGHGVACWGSNISGESGGTGMHIDPPGAIASITDAVQVAVGDRHGCALTSAGTVMCWGDNRAGQIGERPQETASSDGGADRDAAARLRATPVLVEGLRDVVEVQLAASYSCARTRSGQVHCWGQFPGRSAESAEPAGRPQRIAGIDGAVSLAAGKTLACARIRGGSVRCFGHLTGDAGAPIPYQADTPVAGLANVEEVGIGGAFACVRLSNGTVSCWGNNTFGELGNGTIRASSTPSAVPGLSQVVALGVGDQHGCVLLAGGGVRCWGSNAYSQLGDGSVRRRDEAGPVVSITDATQLFAGQSVTCALRREGALSCWGRSRGPQAALTSTPQPVNLGDVAALDLRGGSYCVLRHDGTVACTPREMSEPDLIATAFVPVPGLHDVVQLAAGSDHACVRQRDGAVQCWGAGTYGELGDGTGFAHGPEGVNMWFEHGTPSPAQTPRQGTEYVRDTPAAIETIHGAEEIASGLRHSCVRTVGGHVQCWGVNPDGMLGDHSTLVRLAPVEATAFQGATQLDLGWSEDASCARLANGTVVCTGTLFPSGTPVPGFAGIEQVAVSSAAVCGLRADGTVGCRRTGTRFPHDVVAVPALGDAAQIVAGLNHFCARLRNGSVACWGDNVDGQLGTGRTYRTNSTSPIEVAF